MLYEEDLARVHVDGYGFHWEGAAGALLGWLADAGLTGGTVVDLGCGGGQWLARLIDQGYEACGVDVSPSMIGIARRNAPTADLRCGSFDTIELPPCDAATSLGEPLNYLNSGPKLRRTLRRVYRALRPGGLFVFDVRHPADRPCEPVDRVRSSDDWLCHSRTVEEPGRITRHITTFHREADGRYRRGEEVHRLKVFSRAETTAWLREIGYRVRTKRGYGDYRLGPRQSVFVCRKPG